MRNINKITHGNIFLCIHNEPVKLNLHYYNVQK